MKKIYVFTVLTTLLTPVFAEDAKNPDVTKTATETKVENTKSDVKEIVAKSEKDVERAKSDLNNSDVKQEKISENKTDNKSNPKIKFPRGLEFGLGASATSGVNGFVGYTNKNFDSFWWKRIGGRFDFGTTSPIQSSIDSAIDSSVGDGIEMGDENGFTIKDVSLSAHHYGAMVDFYPFGNTWFLGGWRLTGGYMFGKIGVSAKLTSNTELPSGSMEFELNGEKYQYTGGAMKGAAAVDWNYSGPYLGTGFDLGLIWGIKIYMDAGAVFTNKTAKASLDVPLNGLERWDDVLGWVAADSTSLNQDKAQALADANDELGKIKIFPMVKLGLMYRF